MTRYPPSSNEVQRDLNNTDWTFMHKDSFGGDFPANRAYANSAVGGYEARATAFPGTLRPGEARRSAFCVAN